jgi:O-antigen ligase
MASPRIVRPTLERATAAPARWSRAASPARRAALRVASDPLRVTLFTLIVITVSRIHMQFPALRVLRPAMVLTVLAVGIAYARPNLLSQRPLLETWPAKLIAAFGILACASAPFGISLGNSGLFILNDYGKTIIFAFLIVVATRNARDFYGLVWTIVISTGLLVWLALFVFNMTSYNGYSRLANLYTYDANDLGLVLVLGLAFTLLAFHASGMAGKAVCAVVLVGIGAAISKSGSRGALIGLVASGAATLVLLRGVSVVKRVAIVIVTALALNTFSPPGYWKQMGTLLNPTADYNWDATNGRRQVALRGIGYFEEYPIFGLGIHNFAKAECFISDKAHRHLAGQPIRCTPPHNAYVEAGAELGIGGIILWLLMIPGAVVTLLRIRKTLPREWAAARGERRLLYYAPQYLAVAYVGFAVGSFFLSFAWLDVTYLLPATSAALLIAIAATRRDDGGTPARPPAAGHATRGPLWAGRRWTRAVGSAR